MQTVIPTKTGYLYIYLMILSIFPLLYSTRSFFYNARLPEFIFWLFLIVAAEFKPITITKWNEITISFAIQLAIIILFGTAEAVWIAILGTLIVEVFTRKSLQKILFNTGQYGLTILITGTIYYWLKRSPDHVLLDIVADIPALLTSFTVYFLLNSFFVSAVIALTSGNRFRDIFLSDFSVIIGYYYALTPISVAVTLLYDPRRPFIVLIMIPPLIMADQALRRYYSLQDETMDALNVLADTIDKRDAYTYSHSDRVAEYAAHIARELNLSLQQLNAIETAGRIHDLGKVGIPDNILHKAGRLTEDEYRAIKNHPEIGYQLLKNLKPYKNGAQYVLYHHERIDGKGYPRGLLGKSIPLGAKILAVADSYDAMTSNRVYRQGLSMGEAVDELRKCKDTQFDSKIVDLFIQVLKKHYGYEEA